MAAVRIKLNVELAVGSKFDRFEPDLTIQVDTSSPIPIDTQIDKEEEAIRKSWTRLSRLIEELATKETNYEVKIGDK